MSGEEGHAKRQGSPVLNAFAVAGTPDDGLTFIAKRFASPDVMTTSDGRPLTLLATKS